MRFQSTQSSCGAAALANAHALLVTRPATELEVIDLAKTNWNGTDDKGMLRAAKRLGLKASRIRVSSLANLVTADRVFILATDRWEHWVVAFDLRIGRWLVVDSADNELAFTLSWEELAARCAFPGKRRPIHGIVIEV